MIVNINPISTPEEVNANVLSNTVVRHSLLFGITMIINQSFFSMWIYINTDNLLDTMYFLQVQYLLWSLRALENLVNVLVLWLILRINYHRYICLCKYCHAFIGKCCFNSVDRDTMINNPYLELDDTSQLDHPALS